MNSYLAAERVRFFPLNFHVVLLNCNISKLIYFSLVQETFKIRPQTFVADEVKSSNVPYWLELGFEFSSANNNESKTFLLINVITVGLFRLRENNLSPDPTITLN